ncbi:UDP-4-amino-4,6-dideoxy-N-acetyl-beta-L-altrosamine transaminase [Glaciecola sp. 1036]|uniref:UDP-4-amino-4, 6-dideoxy-N-acetyl-beta-L-altrosamine transaminase n=1 Tax=Alteromonadaceae TaxID=72275 RepID=UPI003D002E41
MIPYGKHKIDPQDIATVVDVLENQFITQGKMVPAFEEALCQYTGAEHCIAVNSGTSGLHVACLSLGIGQGDLVWTSPNSFAASANCARYCGADVDFVDIDPDTRNISLQKLKLKLERAANTQTLPKAIVVVHFAGMSNDMQQLHALCQKYAVAIIEDAAHALGATYLDSKVGSCAYSDFCVLSFHPVKTITTAEGGAVLTNNAELAKQATLFAKHGITRNPDWMQPHSEGSWFYQQLELGYNFRLSDIHAALGISQLKRIDSFVSARVKVAKNYAKLLGDLPIKLPNMEQADSSAWHLYSIQVAHEHRLPLYNYLLANGIGVNVHYIPIHYHPYYQALGFFKGDFPVAENYYHGAISLPIFVDLTDDQQQKVSSLISDFFVNQSQTDDQAS